MLPRPRLDPPRRFPTQPEGDGRGTCSAFVVLILWLDNYMGAYNLNYRIICVLEVLGNRDLIFAMVKLVLPANYKPLRVQEIV